MTHFWAHIYIFIDIGAFESIAICYYIISKISLHENGN